MSPAQPTTPYLPTSMRRVVVNPDGIEVISADVPQPGDEEALVQTVLAGVCGSDTHAAHGRHPHIALPYLPGHEAVGVVRAVGPEVAGVVVGQRVIVEPTLPCWTCKMCTTGRSNLCENLRFFGCGYDQGAMADYFTIPANRLHVVPDELDDLQAVLIEPLATPVHAARLAGDLVGKKVAILGCGTIGLLTLAAVRRHGAATVVMTDIAESKRALAVRLGADQVVDAGDPEAVAAVRAALGESADVVFDCVANRFTVAQAVGMARKAGTVVIVGVPAGDIVVPMAVIQDEQVRIQGSATYTATDVELATQMIMAGEVRSEDFVTARFSLDETAAAFAASSAGNQVKVVVAA